MSLSIDYSCALYVSGSITIDKNKTTLPDPNYEVKTLQVGTQTLNEDEWSFVDSNDEYQVPVLLVLSRIFSGLKKVLKNEDVPSPKFFPDRAEAEG